MCEQLRKPLPLLLPAAHVKLLALVDVKHEGRRLWLVEFCTAALGRLNEVRKRPVAKQQFYPAFLFSDALVFCFELPNIEERIDQRFKRIGTGLEREEAPLPTILKNSWPLICSRDLLRPRLAL